MKMKIIGIISLLILALTGCAKSEDLDPEQDDPAQVSVVLGGAELTSKASYLELSDAEKAIKDYKIFFFNKDRGGIVTLELSGKGLEEASPYSLDRVGVDPGNYRIYAVINSSDLCAKVKTESELLALEADLTKTHSHDALLQIGYVDANIVASSGEQKISIPVRRLCSRVHIGSIRNACGGELTLSEAYLTNVPGACDLSGNVSSSKWYNMYGLLSVPSDPEKNAISVSTGPEPTVIKIGKTIPASATEELENINLYCYPNTLDIDQADTYDGQSDFEPVATYLVLRSDNKGDEPRYYQFRINKDEALSSALKANTTYTLDIVISGAGSTVITDLSTKGIISASVTVTDWDSGTTTTFDM